MERLDISITPIYRCKDCSRGDDCPARMEDGKFAIVSEGCQLPIYEPDDPSTSILCPDCHTLLNPTEDEWMKAGQFGAFRHGTWACPDCKKEWNVVFEDGKKIIGLESTGFMVITTDLIQKLNKRIEEADAIIAVLKARPAGRFISTDHQCPWCKSANHYLKVMEGIERDHRDYTQLICNCGWSDYIRDIVIIHGRV